MAMNPFAAMNEVEELHLRALAICVRRRRLAAGLTQERLASCAGLSPSEIQHIERLRRDPRSGTLKRICAALGISYPELVTEMDRVEHELRDLARQAS